MSIWCEPQGQVWVQRPIGEAFNQEYAVSTVKHPPKVHVWACFCANGVGRIHVFTENLDSELYKNILQEHLLDTKKKYWPNQQWYFQQDNDPKHTSRLVQGWIASKGIDTIDWPPYSPDLNPIENLWADLKKRVEKHNCWSTDELAKAVKEEWWKTDKAYCKKLVDSMPERCWQVIEFEGGATKY